MSLPELIEKLARTESEAVALMKAGFKSREQIDRWNNLEGEAEELKAKISDLRIKEHLKDPAYMAKINAAPPIEWSPPSGD